MVHFFSILLVVKTFSLCLYEIILIGVVVHIFKHFNVQHSINWELICSFAYTQKKNINNWSKLHNIQIFTQSALKHSGIALFWAFACFLKSFTYYGNSSNDKFKRKLITDLDFFVGFSRPLSLYKIVFFVM